MFFKKKKKEKLEKPEELAKPENERPAEPQPKSEPEKKKGLLSRLKSGLSKTSGALTTGIKDVVTKKKLDQDTLDELEELLILADLGPSAAHDVIEGFAKTRFGKDISETEIKEGLALEIENKLTAFEKPFDIHATDNHPHVVVFLGVNGAGKTTTIGKVAAQLKADGKTVMMAACDTFRAAAVEQLQVWGERTGCPVITAPHGADAAAVAFDALDQAKQKNIDVLLIDTAGRLQNKQGLMDELGKILRTIKKKDDTAPHDVMLVLDATVGRNAINQAEGFDKAANVTGLVMTKLDGTARGGVLLPVAEATDLPIQMIGVGEHIDDLQPFSARTFSRNLFDLPIENT